MAQIPRFEPGLLNRRIAGDDVGRAFTRLVYELLRPERPELKLLDAPGKDGAIDLSETREDGRAFIECKHVGTEGKREEQARWREVAARLEKHLASPEGPSKGQSQYAPWYKRDPSAVEYVFCVSSSLGNQERRDALGEEIARFFGELATRHPHLAHLARMRVEVVDWSDLRALLERQPHVAYRWFPSTRPIGAIPLAEPLAPGTFRSYLQSTQLPYFSIESYRADSRAQLSSERDLVQALEGSDSNLVITGRGGVGKTRLMLELGRLAEQKGWTALRVLPSFDRAGLEKLAEDAQATDRILLLVDYVELHDNFDEIAGLVSDLNETYGLCIRYVANCRGTYYPRLAALANHQRLDVSPSGNATADEYRGYGRETVRHILRHSGVEASEEVLSICRDTPVLAVFLSYLTQTGREADLSELLNERDFGSWVAKRVQMSFHEPVKRELAALVALLPMPVSAVGSLEPALTRMLDTLIADGWAERDSGKSGDEYVMAHDVLADQIFVSYVGEIVATSEQFLREVLLAATSTGSVESALVALQRVAAESALESVDWLGLIDDQVDKDPEVWRKSASALLTTLLLEPGEQLELLSRQGDAWRGVEGDVDVQNRIGWLARWVLRQEAEGLQVPRRSTIESWAIAAASAATSINYAITWALRLSPEGARNAALRWIESYPLDFQTHYVLVAWLESGLPPDDIAGAVADWARKFKTMPRLTFIVRAWLDAGGNTDVVREPMACWLAEHATIDDAEFIYTAWLDAGGNSDVVREPFTSWLGEHATLPSAYFPFRAWLKAGGERELVQEPIARWLGEHARTPEASYVYQAWLDAKGQRELVQEPIARWLAEHARTPEARYLYKAWLTAGLPMDVVREDLLSWVHANVDREDAAFLLKDLVKERNLPEQTVHDVLEWCASFPENEDALWRLTALGDRHLLRRGIGDALLEASKAVVDALPPDPDAIMRSQIAALISFLVCSPDLSLSAGRHDVNDLILKWLRHPSCYGPRPRPHRGVQREQHVQRVFELFQRGLIDGGAEQGMRRFLEWVDAWHAEYRVDLQEKIDAMRARFMQAPDAA